MNRNLFISALSIAILLATPAFSQSKDKKASTANGTYKVDTTASKITWRGSKPIGSAHIGAINIKSGDLLVKDNAVQSGQFQIDMNSITNEDLKGSPDYHTKLLTHLKSEDFFHVEKHPHSEFKLTSVEKKADNQYWVKGTLSMIGSTKPVEFPATAMVTADKITAKADLKIDRTLWNLRYGSGKFFKNLGDKMIRDEIELKLDIVATR